MKFMISIAAVLLLIASCDAYERPECEPGDVFDQDCNSCTCTGAGVYVCTFRKCFGKQRLQASATKTVDQACTPNDIKVIECNQCRCSLNGAGWLCTRRLCPSPASQQQKRFKRSNNSNSRRNGSNKKSRNQTETSNNIAESSVASCEEKKPLKSRTTLKLTNSAHYTHRLEVVKETTKPILSNNDGTRIKHKIESSTTSPHSKELTTQSSSTTIPTVIIQEFTEADLEAPNFSCVPKAAFKVDCNTCWCASNGREPKSCTRIACKPREYDLLKSN